MSSVLATPSPRIDPKKSIFGPIIDTTHQGNVSFRISLGKGGYGSTFIQVRPNKTPTVIKVYPPESSPQEYLNGAFRPSLPHPNIVRFIRSSPFADNPSVEMEFVNGITLFDFINLVF